VSHADQGFGEQDDTEAVGGEHDERKLGDIAE
jgi:hypothetical protein